jgi:hypothetical protein
MAINADEAARSLGVVDEALRRSAMFRGYQSAAPQLILWGGLWAVGFAANDVWPSSVNWIWAVIGLGGWGASLTIARRDRGRSVPDKRIFGLVLIIVAFFAGSIIVMAPARPNQVAAFIAIATAACYCGFGIYGLPRLVVTGAAMFGLTLLGYFLLPAYFLLWMAVVGGGGLMLGGFWLRSV